MYMVKAYIEPRLFDSEGNLTTAEGIIIYNDIYATEGAKATNPKLNLKDNSAGSLTITLPPGNAGYDKVERLTTEIVVFRDREEIWSGRVITESKDFWNNRTLTCEGELAYLNDTIQPQKEYEDTSVSEFLTALIDVHNSKADASKQFTIGAVDVYAKDDDGNDETITRITDNENTLTAISEQLVDYFEGHLKVRKENGIRYLDYRQDWTSTNTQEIRFGQNLLDFTRDWDATNFATVVIPRGEALDSSDIDGVTAYLDISDITSTTCPRCGEELVAAEDDDGNNIWQCQNDDCFYYKWYETRLSVPRYSEFPNDEGKDLYVINDSQTCPDCGTAMELNDDGDTFVCPDCGYETEYTPFVIESGENYVANWNAVQQFGRIEVVADWSDVTDAEELLEEAKEYLSDLQFEDLTIEVQAVDLRYLGITDDSVGLLDEIRCVSFAHGLDKKFPVSEMTIQLDQPENSTYTLSESEQTTLTSTVRTATTSVNSETHSITALQAAKNNAAYLINSATRGYVTIGRTGKGTEFIAIADDRSYNADGYSDGYYWSDNTNLWLWNSGGLGFSKDGGRTYVTAMTSDGSIVADRITTGTLTTVVIQDETGNSKWDLTSGEFTMVKGSITLGDDGEFQVDSNGKLTAVSGNIGCFSIDDSSLFTTNMRLYSGGMELSNGVVSESEKENRVGYIGTSFHEGNGDKPGLVFNLDEGSSFMAWGYQIKTSDEDYYTYMLMYAAETLQSDNNEFEAGMLHLGCPIDGHGNVCENFWINPGNGHETNEGGAKGGATYTGTISLPTNIENGLVTSVVTITLKNGFVMATG